MRSSLFPHSRSFRALLVPAGGCVLLALAVSACGMGGGDAAGASASPSPGAGAYFACLQQHGVTTPTARPTARPTAFPSGGFAANPATAKAREACASLRPAGGSGGFGGFGGFGQALQAFRTCMADHGAAIPDTRPAAPPTSAPSPGADRFLNGLNPSNPKVAAALKACQSKLPAFPGAVAG